MEEVLVLQRKENDSSMNIVWLFITGTHLYQHHLKMYDQAVCVEVGQFTLEKAVQVEYVYTVRVGAMEVEF